MVRIYTIYMLYACVCSVVVRLMVSFNLQLERNISLNIKLKIEEEKGRRTKKKDEG